MVERAESSRVTARSSRPGALPIAFDESTLSKARWCRGRLLAWYSRHGRQFPWRSRDANAYEQVVAEVLLQRTQASTVGRFFQSFFERFGSWGEIDAAPDAALEVALRPIGLWRRRAAALKGLAREMVVRGGQFPDSRDELQTMPAVGQYVASAVLLFGHGRAEPLLDGGMARVIERVFEPRRLVDIRYDLRLQGLARLLVRSRKPARVNWSILDLAALYCNSRSPACEKCPLKKRCTFALSASSVARPPSNRC